MAEIYDEQYAVQLDLDNNLGDFPDRFCRPGGSGDEVGFYFAGNSLGPMPISVPDKMAEVCSRWADLGVDAHFDGPENWFTYHHQVRGGLARVLGANESEVVAMNSLSVNLHLMLTSFYTPQGEKTKIAMEYNPFQSDITVVDSHIRSRGLNPLEEVIHIHGEDKYLISTDEIINVLDSRADEIALLLLPGVHYLSGQVIGMEELTKYAHERDIVVGFDQAHASGNIELELSKWDVDFAVGCTYKYLCGGPGAIGFAYMNERYHDGPDINRLIGWWALDPERRFEMTRDIPIITDADGWQQSNPSVFSIVPLISALEIYDDAGMENIRKVAIDQSNYAHDLLTQIPGVEIISPQDVNERGAQLSITTPMDAQELKGRLWDEGSIRVDERNPNIIRIASHPLWVRFEHINHLAQTLDQILK